MSAMEFSGRTVLCVDSHAESREALVAALDDYDVSLASNAFEALGQINRRGFHGYVLDYWLSDLPGATLCQEIRKLDPHAPIVFCTAAQRPVDRARALRAGAQGYLHKPVDAALLRAKLKALFLTADVESLRARIDEERAIHDELQRRSLYARERSAEAMSLSAQSVERTARIRAMKAFVEARGTRAHFEHWWPQVFQSTRAQGDRS
jgi:DNA-binding response OmpR family regulator